MSLLYDGLLFLKGGIISRVFLRVGTQGSVEEVFFVICCCVSTPVIVSSLLQISVVLGLHFNVVIATSTSVSHGASLVIASLASFLISCIFLLVCETVSQTVAFTGFLRCSRSGQSQLKRLLTPLIWRCFVLTEKIECTLFWDGV